LSVILAEDSEGSAFTMNGCEDDDFGIGERRRLKMRIVMAREEPPDILAGGERAGLTRIFTWHSSGVQEEATENFHIKVYSTKW
jgi:hypothetical protein